MRVVVGPKEGTTWPNSYIPAMVNMWWL